MQRTAEHGWTRALITGLEEEQAHTFLYDLGVPARTPRRLLKPLAEEFSLQPQHTFRLQLAVSRSELSRTELLRRLQELINKSEKVVSVQVEIFEKSD